jgi:hypothetical protein
MNATEKATQSWLAKRSSKPQTWTELKAQGNVIGGMPRIENGNIILPLEAVEKLSKSAKTYMRFSTGGLFIELPDGSRLQASHIVRWNPTYTESRNKLMQMKLEA